MEMKRYSDVVIEEDENEDGDDDDDDDKHHNQYHQQQQLIRPIPQNLYHESRRPLTTSVKMSEPTQSKNPIIRPTVHEFYFPSINPTVQTYYRFKTSQVTPFAALHTRPLDGPFGRMMDTSSSSSFNYGSTNGGLSNSSNYMGTGGGGSHSVSNVTGLLRRSAVLPCHGTFFIMIQEEEESNQLCL